MHHSHAHWHPWGCHDHHGHHGRCGCAPPMYAAVLIPWQAAPWVHQPYGCAPAVSPMVVPHEISADTASGPSEAMIGGSGDARLGLEYMPDEGATSPSVKVTIKSDGTTSVWEETAIAGGYHVRTDFTAVRPGSKVTLEVTETSARLRWCETVCC